MQKNLPLRIVEILVLTGIALAFILPVFSSSQSETQTSYWDHPLKDRR